MKKMGQRIHDKRKELKLTQEELGRKLDPPVKRQAICKWELGETGEIKRSYIAQLAHIFDCDPVWLMGLENVADVKLTYNADGCEPVNVVVDHAPIIGDESAKSQRTLLYKIALQVKPENLPIAISLLKDLI